MMKRLTIVACLLPSVLGACATAGATRERGLGDLRSALGLTPPAGSVVDGRLVHTATGVSLLAVPRDGWLPGMRSGRTLLFEGTPGVALVLDGGGAALVRMNGDKPEWTKALEPPLPTKVVSLHTADAALPQPGDPSNATADEIAAETPTEVTLTLDVPQYAAGATATFSAGGLEITSADEGDSILSLGAEAPSDECGGGYTIAFDRGVTTDGATWFHFVSELAYRETDDGCTAEMRAASRKAYVDGSSVRTRHNDVWFVFPADGGDPYVVSSESSTDEEDIVERTTFRDVKVPGGHVTFTAQLVEAYQGEDSWSWNLVDGAGDTFALAASD